MFTRVTLLKRRSDLSMAAFRDYYEAHHRRIGERVLAGYAVRYVRRYIEPLTDGACPGFDVIMEIDFPDRHIHDLCIASLSQPDVAREIVEDEERIFDRQATISFTVEECESVLPGRYEGAGDMKNNG